MKRIVLILLTAFAFSCAERELQLPVTTANDITEILDVSPIYMFYDEATDSVDFNRKNMISTTNWLVNIDKRLTLKQILPHLQYLQEKRRGDGMHKNENAKNYFTCFNENTKSLSFIEFTDVEYQKGSSTDYLTKISDLNNPKTIITIEVNSTNDITIVNPSSENITSKSNISNLLSILRQINNQENFIYLNFPLNLNFQDYIAIKTKLLEIDFDSIHISEKEFIYN
jgi:biopolymer transport protein ExbD